MVKRYTGPTIIGGAGNAGGTLGAFQQQPQSQLQQPQSQLQQPQQPFNNNLFFLLINNKYHNNNYQAWDNNSHYHLIFNNNQIFLPTSPPKARII